MKIGSGIRAWYITTEYRLQHAGGFRPRGAMRLVQWVGWQLYLLRRYVQGGRRVTEGPTSGYLHENGIAITFGGMCPVQGDGVVDGRTVYYRSRGEGWQFHVACEDGDDALDQEAFCYAEKRYFFPAGGYVDSAVSIACIRKAVTEWRKAGRP